jgi:hypothetical protein
MALLDTTWYCNGGDGSTTGYWAVPAWVAGSKAAGVICRQGSPAVGNERIFACIVAGTTGGSEPTWILTRGAKTTDNTVTWQEVTGQALLNGDHINATTTAQTRSFAAVLGQLIYDVGTASVQICTTAGTTGSATPAFSATPGVAVGDGAAVWISLGVVSAYANWANPHARTVNALGTNWGSPPGSTIYVAGAHTEISSVATNWAGAGTQANPIKVLCVNAAGSMPPTAADLTTGALVAQSTAGSFTNTMLGLYCYGIEFRIGAINNTSSLSSILMPQSTGLSAALQIYKNCKFTIGSNNAASRWSLGAGGNSSGGNLIWEDCQIGINSASQIFGGTAGPIIWEWRNPSGIAGVTGVTGAIPQGQLLSVGAVGMTFDAVIDGVDLSALSAQLLAGSNNILGNVVLKDCILRGLTGPFMGNPGPGVDYLRCDSAGTNYQHMRGRYAGQVMTETAIVRTGGAHIQGTALSWKIITSANASWIQALRCAPLTVPNALTGANRTVTVYGTINAAAVPTNADIWILASYLGSSSSSLASFKSSGTPTHLTAGSPVNSDGSSWGGGGSGAGWSPFSLSVVLTSPTPAQSGTIYVTAVAAKPGTTWYIDPQPVIS